MDIEFIAQYLQLKFASERPEILDTNTENALEKLSTAKLLDKNKSVALIPHYGFGVIFKALSG